jgi:hypothetical protein
MSNCGKHNFYIHILIEVIFNTIIDIHLLKNVRDNELLIIDMIYVVTI